MTSSAFRPQISVGSILGSGFHVFRQHTFAFLGMVLIGLLPGIVVGILAAFVTEDGLTPAWLDVLNAIASVGGYVSFGAGVHAAVQTLQGQPVYLSESVSMGLRRFFPVFAVTLLYVIAVVLGAVALIIGLFFVMAILHPALAVAVVERRGVFGALKRGAELSKGNRLTLFFTGVVFVGCTMGAMFLLLFVLGLLATSLGFAAGDSGAGGIVAAVLVFLLMVPLYLSMLALYAILTATAYHELRVEKDGAAPEQLAGVFA